MFKNDKVQGGPIEVQGKNVSKDKDAFKNLNKQGNRPNKNNDNVGSTRQQNIATPDKDVSTDY